MDSLDDAVRRSVKKVRRRWAEPPDLDSNDPIVDDNGRKVDGKKVPSWRDKLIGNHLGSVNWQEDEFDLLDGGVTKEIVNGIPTITFSERVNQYIA